MNAVTLVLTVFAVARITRLVTSDRITEAPRDWILDRINPHGLATYLITCSWCVSVYAGFIVAPVAHYWGNSPWFTIPAIALTASYITGYLASLTKGDD
jgi:hypothetical protein